MAAPSALTIFDSFLEYLGDGTFDLNANTFKASLHTSALTPDATLDMVFADLGSEVTGGNGYTAGGATLANVVWSRTGAVVKFDADDVSWTGSGAGFVARWLVIRAVGTLNGRVDPLVGYMLLDSAPADFSFAPGNPITVIWHSTGIFRLTKV